MKLQEITKQERDALFKKFRAQAVKLARDHKKEYGYYRETRYWFSDASIVCNFREPVWIGERFRVYRSRNISRLLHFLPSPCLYTKPGEIACCIATIRTGNTWRHYYCEHPVGQCPHKE